MQQGPVYQSRDFSNLLFRALGKSVTLRTAAPFLDLLNLNASIICSDGVLFDTTHILLFISELTDLEYIAPILEQFLQDPRVDPTQNNNEALRTAANNGHTKAIEILLKDPRVDPNGALLCAVLANKMEVFRLLFEDPRINPDATECENWTMKWAVGNNHHDIIYSLCSRFPRQLDALKQIDKDMHDEFVKKCYQSDFDLYAKLYQVAQKIMLPTDIVKTSFALHSICTKTPIYMPDYVDLYLSNKKTTQQIKKRAGDSCEESRPIAKRFCNQ